jgi:hypothetical protein
MYVGPFRITLRYQIVVRYMAFTVPNLLQFRLPSTTISHTRNTDFMGDLSRTP